MKKVSLLSKNDLANHLGVSIPTINRYMKEKKLSFIKLGRRVFFSPQQVEEDLALLTQYSNQSKIKEA